MEQNGTWGFAMVFIKKINTIWSYSKRYCGCYEYFYKGSDVCGTSLCDAIANIYDEIVLEIFVNTIAKPYMQSCQLGE